MGQFERVYTHKRYGEIARIDIAFPTDGWAINGTPLPERAVQHLVRHATQSLLDSYAGAQTRDLAIAAFDKKFDRILGGEIGIRATGPRNPLRTLAIQFAEPDMAGKTAKERHAKAVALIDATPNSGPYWEFAAETLERRAALATPDVSDMESDVEDADEIDESDAEAA